jgi:predicted ATPase
VTPLKLEGRVARLWESVREKAVEKLTRSHRAEVLRQQAADWGTAQQISAYAEAMEHASSGKDAAEIEATAEWVAWARNYAHNLNPLNRELHLPKAPEPTAQALEPFMRLWSPYGPHR